MNWAKTVWLRRWFLPFFCHFADHSQLCLLLSNIEISPLWTESVYYGQNQSIMDWISPLWTESVYYGQNQSIMDRISLLWTESVHYRQNLFCSCLMCCVLTKYICILVKVNFFFFFVCLLGYCVFSLWAFCKPLDLNSHFVLKIVCSVCDGIFSHHYSQTLDATASW